MNCGCSTAAGWARWIAILLLFAAGIVISVFHTREVHRCNECETITNVLGQPERVCSDYKGSDMNWADLEDCSQLTLILTTAGFLLSFGLALSICVCMVCLPPPGSKAEKKSDNNNGATNQAQNQAEGKPNGAKEGTNGTSGPEDSRHLQRPKKPTPVAVSVTSGGSASAPNESAYASSRHQYRPVSTGAAPPGYDPWRPQSNPWSSPAHSSPLGQHEPLSASRSSQLGNVEFLHNQHHLEAPLHEQHASESLHQGGSSTIQDGTKISQAQPSHTAARAQTSQSAHTRGAAPASTTPGTYPVDAWLEGRDHMDNGEDNLAPLHKVESLMNGISLKDVVAAAPENPVTNDNNSMHADFGDTTTTTTTNTFTTNTNTFTTNTNTYTTTHTTTQNTTTPAGLGLGGDTMHSTPGVAGDTHVSTPPHTPPASNNNTTTTTAVGRPPATTSGQLQAPSMQSVGNFGFGVAGSTMLSAGNTTGAPESSMGMDTRSGAPEMVTSPTTSDAAAAGRSIGPPAAGAQVELDLSPQPSGGSIPKVPGSFAGQDIWSKDLAADSAPQGDSTDSTKAAYRDSAMLAVHLKEGDVADTDGRAVPVAQVAAHAGEAVRVRPTEEEPDGPKVSGMPNESGGAVHASNKSPPLQSFGSAFGPNWKAQGAAGSSPSGSKGSPEDPGASDGEDGVRKDDVNPTAGQQGNGELGGDSSHDNKTSSSEKRENARSSIPSGGSATAGMTAASRIRSSQESAVSGSEHSSGAKMLSGAAGDKEEAQMAWGWSGADKGWAKVPQDLAIVSKPVHAADAAAPAAPPAAAQAAPATTTVTAPPVRRAHWLMMDKVSSSELKEAGVGLNSDLLARDKKKRGVQGKHGSKLHADQTIPEHEVAKVSVHANATGHGSVAGQNAAQQADECEESGVIGMPAPPVRAPVQNAAHQKGAAAPQQVRSADKARSKPFGWKALERGQQASFGNRSKAAAAAGRGATQGRDAAQGSQGRGQLQAEGASQGSRGAAQKHSTKGGISKEPTAGTSEKTAPSRGRANILGWLERGEEAMKDALRPQKDPLDSLDSDYKLDMKYARESTAAGTSEVDDPLNRPTAATNSSKSHAAGTSRAGTNVVSRVSGAAPAPPRDAELAYNLAYSPYGKKSQYPSNQQVQGLDSEGNVLTAREFREGTK